MFTVSHNTKCSLVDGLHVIVSSLSCVSIVDYEVRHSIILKLKKPFLCRVQANVINTHILFNGGWLWKYSLQMQTYFRLSLIPPKITRWAQAYTIPVE